MRVAIIGAGQMGEALRRVAEGVGHQVTAIVGRPLEEAFWDRLSAEVVIDFSHASQVRFVVERCLSRGIPLVTGTTGWTAEEEELRRWAKAVPGARWIWGGNFSRGVALLKLILQKVHDLWPLFSDWEGVLVETHHSRKKDAPSGTAIELQRFFPALKAIYSLRVGQIVGEHALLLSGMGEEVEILHRAHDRKVFADGALWAAHWLLQQNAYVGRFEEVFLAHSQG
ncbi:MAG: hypothetical protein N2170_09485 [Bacteroidia bacterium]|nr:hypothetical protein [Bacteroidia bacterium]